jgi:flavin-dependent dehydrogenase
VDREIVQVVGAGPAGLAAAITLARGGRRVVVHEAAREVGHRVRGDLQGLENWSTAADVLDVLREAGITTAFATLPCAQGTAFDAWDGAHPIRSRAPLFYLLERGPGRGSLDAALLEQALGLGVEVRFRSRVNRLEGPGILATGPKAADAIAVGYLFDTRMEDGFWVVLDDEVAPLGYAYLLVMRGRATLKTCLFGSFREQKRYVERTVERFRRLVGLEMRNERFHGAVGNFCLPASARSGPHPVAGEHAGFQDAFAGFGMRYAILSGVMAARSMLAGTDYDALWRPAFAASIESSVINRAIFGALGNRGYRWLLRAQAVTGDARVFLRLLYRPARVRRLLLPWARRRYRSQRRDEARAGTRPAMSLSPVSAIRNALRQRRVRP